MFSDFTIVVGEEMSICFLSSLHPPLDKRVFDKEAISLKKAGFDVTHIAPSKEANFFEKNIKILTYPPPENIFSRIFQIPKIYNIAVKNNSYIYHCNEIDSWFVGILLRIFHGKKVVFDVHEHYPSVFAESRFPRWMHLGISAIVRLLLRTFSLFTDRIVFAKRSVALDFRGFEAKQVLVQNFTSLSYMKNAEEDSIQGIVQDSSSMIKAIHLGLISHIRGWPQLLEALARVKTQELDVHIVGTFNDGSRQAFETRLLSLGLETRVTIEEWMPFAQAYQRLLASHIGLVLFQPGIQNHVYALPHKIFDYMLAGLPVIAPSFAEEVAPIIEEADCGVLVDPSDPEQIAEALDYLATHPQERKRLGENGRRAVLDRYNWEAEAEKLIAMYVELYDSVKK
jgi:glycosyltransferase involved in cell wall biosynthesis